MEYFGQIEESESLKQTAFSEQVKAYKADIEADKAKSFLNSITAYTGIGLIVVTGIMLIILSGKK